MSDVRQSMILVLSYQNFRQDSLFSIDWPPNPNVSVCWNEATIC